MYAKIKKLDEYGLESYHMDLYTDSGELVESSVRMSHQGARLWCHASLIKYQAGGLMGKLRVYETAPGVEELVLT